MPAEKDDLEKIVENKLEKLSKEELEKLCDFLLNNPNIEKFITDCVKEKIDELDSEKYSKNN